MLNLAVMLRESAGAAPTKPVALFDGANSPTPSSTPSPTGWPRASSAVAWRPATRWGCSCPTCRSSWWPTSGSSKPVPWLCPADLGTETQVWDEAGRQLPPGRDNVGELVTRGFHVMKGYRNNPEATAEAFAGGWLHTGDLEFRDTLPRNASGKIVKSMLTLR
jgi:acyl-CoA synthetase (AMP-forming)/AMP-acid ligase II